MAEFNKEIKDAFGNRMWAQEFGGDPSRITLHIAGPMLEKPVMRDWEQTSFALDAESRRDLMDWLSKMDLEAP